MKLALQIFKRRKQWQVLIQKIFHMTQNPHFRTGTRIQSIGKQRRSLPFREQTKGIHVQKLESSRQKSLLSDELLSTDKFGPAFRRFA